MGNKIITCLAVCFNWDKKKNTFNTFSDPLGLLLLPQTSDDCIILTAALFLMPVKIAHHFVGGDYVPLPFAHFYSVIPWFYLYLGFQNSLIAVLIIITSCKKRNPNIIQGYWFYSNKLSSYSCGKSCVSCTASLHPLAPSRAFMIRAF